MVTLFFWQVFNTLHFIITIIIKVIIEVKKEPITTYNSYFNLLTIILIFFKETPLNLIIENYPVVIFLFLLNQQLLNF